MTITNGFSKSINDLTPLVKKKWEALIAAWKLSDGFKKFGMPIVTMTLRTTECQLALIAQGRESLNSVNAKRAKCGMYLLKESENKSPVSWIKPKNVKTAPHCVGIAVDFFLDSNRDGKVDSKDWIEDDGFIAFGKFAKTQGWTWGGNVKVGGDFKSSSDLPHIQYDKKV